MSESPFAALLPPRSDLRAMVRHPRADVVAGLTTGVVALPLALAFGVASGMGAAAGLTTAIVAGVLAALLGGSRVQVSGPTGAMAVVLVPITAAYGTGGVLLAGLLAGLLLVAAGVLRLGRFVAYLPVPVVEGFTAGIAVVIALQQVPLALGLPAHGERVGPAAWHAVADWARQPTYAALALAAGVVLLIWAGHHLVHAFPTSLVAVGAATLTAELLHLDVPRIGTLPASLGLPSVSDLPWAQLDALLPGALAIAALAGIESLLAATVADGLARGTRHDPDRELFGQGVANVVVPLFGGMPATGAIARTAVSVRAGAVTRLAAVVHAVVLLVVVLALSPLVGRIPLAALAGVLLATAARMADVRALRTLVRTTRKAALVVVATLLATVLLDLVKAVELGLAIAVVLALRQVARSARIDRTTPTAHLDAAAAPAHELLDEHVVVFRIDGSLFFATAHRLLGELLDVADVRVVVLALDGVTVLDTTGARLLADTIAGLQARGVTVLLSSPRPEHRAILESLGVIRRLGAEQNVYADVGSALDHARELVGAHQAVTAGDPG